MSPSSKGRGIRSGRAINYYYYDILGKIYPQDLLSWLKEDTKPYHLPDVKIRPEISAFFKEGTIIILPLIVGRLRIGFLLLGEETRPQLGDFDSLKAISPLVSSLMEIGQRSTSPFLNLHR